MRQPRGMETGGAQLPSAGDGMDAWEVGFGCATLRPSRPRLKKALPAHPQTAPAGAVPQLLPDPQGFAGRAICWRIPHRSNLSLPHHGLALRQGMAKGEVNESHHSN